MSVLAHNRSSAPSQRLAETTTGTARPLLCFVYSPTSGPSRRAEGFLAQVLQRRKNHQTFVVQRINCLDRPDLAKKLGAETVPSLVVVENRRVRARLERVRGCRDIEQLLEPWLGVSDDGGLSAASLVDGDEATPPAPVPVPEPYPPPDELDLPNPDPDPDRGSEGDDGSSKRQTEEVARCPREA